MAKITFENHIVELDEGETVLSGLIRCGAEPPHSCDRGICNVCILRCIEGDIPLQAQLELRPSITELGCFRTCQCVPEGDMVLERPREGALFGRGIIYRKEQMSPTVIRLLLDPATQMYYHAGQFINLRAPDGTARSYSIASVPYDDYCLEVHVKRVEGGKVSDWVANALQEGDIVDFQGPYGNCYYFPGETRNNMLLVATGAGLGALVGIIRDALNSGHKGQIHLYHGTRDPQDLYLKDELEELRQNYGNFHFTQCCSGADVPDHMTQGRSLDVALYEHRNLEGWRVYLAGNPDMVYSGEKRTEAAGANPIHIHLTPFENHN